MEIVNKKIKDLIPYENNPRINDDAVEYVAKSIEEFGFKVPCVIDKNNILVTGHTRLKAAKKLKMKQIPCIIADDLSEEQIKAFRLADNKVSEQAEWDMDKLYDELDDILELDMSDFDFDIDDIVDEIVEKEIQHEKNINKPLDIIKKYNISDFDPNRAEGKYEMPILEPVDYKPSRLVGFNYVKSATEYDYGIHFYLDDYQFERVWNEPEKYIEMLREFECVLTPHYSVYSDMSAPLKIYNTFRGKLLGQMMQDAGIIVIPTVYWGGQETYDYEFDGLPENSTLSIYTMNWARTEEVHKSNLNGLKELLKRKHPKRLLIYGNGNATQIEEEIDFGDCELCYFSNEVTDRMKNMGKGEIDGQ